MALGPRNQALITSKDFMDVRKNFNRAFGIDAEKMRIIIRMIFMHIRLHQQKDLSLTEIEHMLLDDCFD